MKPAVHRNTKITVNTKAIEQNVLNRVALLEPNQELFAVVKANGYGHGAVETALAAKAGGATGFCVAVLDEALELREAGISDPILVLGISRSEDAVIFAEQQISATISSVDWLLEASKVMMDSGKTLPPLHVHLALDTGMGRIGVRNKRGISLVEKFITSHHEYFALEGVFTHFAKADDEDTAHVEAQLAKFEELVDSFNELPKYVHCSNSAWALWHRPELSSIVRYGVAMYGINPSNGELPLPVALEPALSLTTEMVYVKQLHKGDTISYGATYVCQESEWIATLPIGYADGWLRSYNTLEVLVDGKRCPVAGRICMDQMMIRLPEYYPAGTKVTLIGKSGEDLITAEEVSHHGGTIGYEVVCLLSDRIPREYVAEFATETLDDLEEEIEIAG
ncbi:alanine racemase [Granulicatella balaenopterae]|nr:alanine racemase [Granulicatella balaenopterae]